MYRCFKINKILAVVISIIIITGILIFPLKNIVVTADAEVHEGIFLPVIMYHSILKDTSRSGKFVITPDTLENDLKYLSEHGYNAVLVKDLINYVYNDIPLPENPVMITFDDGYYNNMVYALPLLEKYNMKAVISIVGTYTEDYSKTDDKNPSYAFCSWEDLKELSKSPCIEIGNHTFNMHSSEGRKGCMKLWNESDEEYARSLDSDILRLQTLLTENSECTPETFAYPFGHISRESIPILKNMGFKATLTCYERANYITKDPDTLFGINRYNRPSGISTEEFMKKALCQN